MPVVVRPAALADLDALLALEQAAFASDRMTRRQLRHMITRAQAVFLVAVAGDGAESVDRAEAVGKDEPVNRAKLARGDERGGGDALAQRSDLARRNELTHGNKAVLGDKRVRGQIPPDKPPRETLLGDVLVLFNRATSVARLYSIAVAEHARGQGIGRALVEAAERATWARERAYLRLEIRRDNLPSQRLFESLGYRRFGVRAGYYQDKMEALRYEKTLMPAAGPARSPAQARVPFYEQTLDFTCGASCLMMAMKALDDGIALDRTLELRIWREATTIFMTSGHGGCGPFGLALAAHRRGFGTEVFVNDRGVPLIDSVRSPEKKEVMRLVHEDMLAEIERLGIPLTYTTLDLETMEARFAAGAVPLVLISSYRIYAEKFPHWVVVTGFDDSFVYVHDPYVDVANGETPLDSINMPIQHSEFRRMARYGRAGLQAVVLISRSSLEPPEDG